MVLVFSLWDDHRVAMLWLDQAYGTNKDRSQAGIDRGPCPTSSGPPNDVESQSPDATVVNGNIKSGALDAPTKRPFRQVLICGISELFRMPDIEQLGRLANGTVSRRLIEDLVSIDHQSLIWTI
jgi:hypothetical protein